MGAIADQDLLSGSLEDFLAQLRGENTFPVVRPTGGTAADPTKPTNRDIMRAGLARLRRARVVDAFGQFVDLIGSSAMSPGDDTLVKIGASEAVPDHPGLIALVPRLNAKARVLLRYTDATGFAQDATTAITPLCGFVLPSPLDGSLEFFAADGTALGRIRPTDTGAAWRRPRPDRFVRPTAEQRDRQHVPRRARRRVAGPRHRPGRGDAARRTRSDRAGRPAPADRHDPLDSRRHGKHRRRAPRLDAGASHRGPPSGDQGRRPGHADRQQCPLDSAAVKLGTLAHTKTASSATASTTTTRPSMPSIRRSAPSPRRAARRSHPTTSI